MIIEIAERDDLPEILMLQKEAFTKEAEEYNNFLIDPMVQMLESLTAQYKTHLFLKICSSDGTIIGSARGYVKDGTSYIGHTFVKPDYQGKGIGTCLSGNWKAETLPLAMKLTQVYSVLKI